jgi:hypothetical protein
MPKVVTEDGLVEEDGLSYELWREDSGASWTIVHQLKDATGRVVRRDSWVNFKAGPVPPTDITIGDFNG